MIPGNSENKAATTQTESTMCACCGGNFSFEFPVASWRSPFWDEYQYGECERCESLTLIDKTDPSEFYDSYFSFEARTISTSRRALFLGRLMSRLVFPNSKFGRSIRSFIKRPYWVRWFAGSGITLGAHVVEIGSGSGALLLHLNRHGFQNLTGLDPYLPADITYSDSVRVLKSTIENNPLEANVVVFKHSLEHVDSPLTALRTVHKLLGSKGIVVIEIPVAQGPIWLEYRDNWVALDAPIHRFIPTQAGIELLCEATGFSIESRFGQSTEFHLVASEIVTRRLSPLTSDASKVLKAKEYSDLSRKAKRIRDDNSCPQMTFLLRKRR